MDTESLVIAYGLVLVGLLAFGFGVRTWLGKNRAWYLVPNYYVLLPKTGHYALPVLGLMLITLGISLVMSDPETGRKILIWVTFPLMTLGLLVIMFQPKWFKPKWVRWLEGNHGDIVGLLIEEARQTSDWRDWARRVSTQEGLEAWVAEVRRKHGLDKNRRIAAG
jgi:uncharacterized membrane protein